MVPYIRNDVHIGAIIFPCPFIYFAVNDHGEGIQSLMRNIQKKMVRVLSDVK